MQNMNDEIIACPACDKPLRKRPLHFPESSKATLWTDGKMTSSLRSDTHKVVRCTHCQELFWVETAMRLWKHYRSPDLSNIHLDNLGFSKSRFDSGSPAGGYVIPRFLKNRDIRRKGNGGSLQGLVARISTKWAETKLHHQQDGFFEQPPPKWADAPLVEHPDAERIAEAIVVTTDPERRCFLVIMFWHQLNDTVRSGHAIPTEWASLFKENLELLLRILDDSDPRDRRLKVEVLRELGRFEEALQLLNEFDESWRWAAVQIAELARAGKTEVAPLHRPVVFRIGIAYAHAIWP